MNSRSAQLVLYSSTLADNIATSPSGADSIYTYSYATTDVSGNIFKARANGINFFNAQYGSFVSGGYNLSSDSASNLLRTTGDIVNSNPLLGNLQNNGGPTETMALLSGSPAIDRGNTTLTTDQRGLPRPRGNAPDIGAFEVQNPAASPKKAAPSGSSGHS